tara:strand:+ start:118071 stop:118202 length:132 start_codon:yes stop_codon:yes gene_type:complete
MAKASSEHQVFGTKIANNTSNRNSGNTTGSIEKSLLKTLQSKH